jgi:U3 small nucleolar RNA-associated protein 7
MPHRYHEDTEDTPAESGGNRVKKDSSVMKEWQQNMKKDLHKAKSGDYTRGKVQRHRSASNKKLNSKLKLLEKTAKESAYNLAQAETLLPEEAGYLEAEGMERTYKFAQSDIVANVDVATSQKSFELDLEEFGPYRLDYTRNGRWMLIGGRKGHVATFDWKTAKLGCELQLKETVRDIWYLNNHFTN